MSDPNQIRINELARELEIKAKVLIDFLPEIGVTEKKTHSSSLDLDHAELARKHFHALAEAEAAAESEKQAKATAAKARPAAKPVAAPPPAAVARPAAPVVSAAPAATVAPPAAKPAAPPPVAAPAAVVPPAAAPLGPRPPLPARAPISAPSAPPAAAPRPAAVPPVTHPVAVKPAAATPAAPAARPASTIPSRTPIGARPSAASPSASASPSARSAAPPKPVLGPMPKIPQRPMIQAPPSAQRESPAGMRPAAAGRPGAAQGERAGGASRFPARPGGRPGSGGIRPTSSGPGAKPSGGAAPAGKAEPGKPLYARKPTPSRGRPLIEKRFAEGERKLHPVRTRPGVGAGRTAQAEAMPAPVQREPRAVVVTEGITVRELAEKLDVRAKELLKSLMDKGMFASINQALDVQTATQLAESFNGIVEVVSFEQQMVQEETKHEEATGNLTARAPVVTVMGHVDHGKTSLLDAIRETDVAAGESGGITQHIGAYEVRINDRRIVFIDTPGHEAFTRMRARGAKVTDIVVLVVGADDGVMPQTEEAIDHARAAKVPIIVAINKIDIPDAQPERVKRQLADRNLMPEEWGGDTVMVEVSAKTKKNIPRLLEMILLVGDLRELKANADAAAAGTVLESRVDKGRGPVATVLVQNGTLHVGDFFVCGAVYGKVRALFNDRGQPVKEAGPATPVEVLGLQGVPDAGDQFQVTDEAKARHIVEYRQGKLREATLAKSSSSRLTLDQLHEQLRSGEVKELPIVIKADVQGSVEVLSEMLPKLSTDQVKLKIIHASVGAVSETDVLLASASNAIIIGFGVRPERKAADLAQQEGVDIRLHTIIYELSDELKKAMTGLLTPVVKEVYLGRAEVRNTFRIKGSGMIAGSYVQDGIIKRDAEVRVLRDNAVIYTGRVVSLKRFKEDANEVRSGFECGISISNFADVKVGDVLECFTLDRSAAAAS
jgi:translation initiation factor IF-2